MKVRVVRAEIEAHQPYIGKVGEVVSVFPCTSSVFGADYDDFSVAFAHEKKKGKKKADIQHIFARWQLEIVDYDDIVQLARERAVAKKATEINGNVKET